VPIIAKDQSYIIAEKIRSIIAQFDSKLDFHITGLPVAEDQFGYEMFVQMGVAAPLAGLAIFALLWYFFRNIALITSPMIVAMATVIIIMGSLIGLGFTVHIMSSMIAIFLMPIAVVDSVHILSEFADRYKAGDNVNIVVKKVMGHLYTPMLYTSVTSAIGFYSLMLTPIPPVQVFGAFIGTGILLAFALTIIFIPAYLSRLSPKTLVKLQESLKRMEEKGRLASTLQSIGRFASHKTKLILVFFIAVFIISIEGINRIEINDNTINWFKSDHEIRIADKVLNTHFAGTYDAWLIFERNTPKSTLALEQFKQQLIIADIESANPSLLKVQTLLTKNDNVSELTDDLFFTQSLLVTLDELSFSADEKDQQWLADLYILAENTYNNQQLFKNPELLTWLDKLTDAITSTELVGKANGLTDIIKTVNRELHSGQATDFTLPASSNAVAQTLLQ
jgi:predicted RND superfamily exporter protein